MTDDLSGEVTGYSYDQVGRLAEALSKNGATTVSDYQYCYDANGNLVSRSGVVLSIAGLRVRLRLRLPRSH